jgi:ribonuclease HII
MMDFTFETTLQRKGFAHIAGIDEAGRGPLAGPVTAAACILPADFPVQLLDDSKKCTEARREELFEVIIQKAISYGIASVTHTFIDTYGIVPAVHKAMRTAIQHLDVTPDFLVFDGYNINYPGTPQEAIIRGDGLVASIAAASILAKVTRDRKMCALDKKYPAYGFSVHKGYGTEAHRMCIKQYGLSPVHRTSFTLHE